MKFLLEIGFSCIYFFESSWILLGTLIDQPLSLKYFFISPIIVGVAKLENSKPLLTSKRSMANIKPSEATW